jgi:hypothetical protein
MWGCHGRATHFLIIAAGYCTQYISSRGTQMNR